MNGLHAFPDKSSAFKELRRVTKNDGMLIGCCYIKGELKRTDFVAKKIYTPKGFFTPPFFTKSELETEFRKLWNNVKISTIGGIAGFKCRNS
jgi:ubiquinone/menaquinone biosynthesis C-methylase UbiE